MVSFKSLPRTTFHPPAKVNGESRGRTEGDARDQGECVEVASRLERVLRRHDGTCPVIRLQVQVKAVRGNNCTTIVCLGQPLLSLRPIEACCYGSCARGNSAPEPWDQG